MKIFPINSIFFIVYLDFFLINRIVYIDFIIFDINYVIYVISISFLFNLTEKF